MLFELRFYYIQPGMMTDFLKIMESQAIPFQLSKGMQVLGSFVGVNNENCYVWLRRYKDENEKQKLYDNVYGSDYWKNEIHPKVSGMIIKEKTQVNMLKATSDSIIQ